MTTQETIQALREALNTVLTANREQMPRNSARWGVMLTPKQLQKIEGTYSATEVRS
jgi:hypothetical protein